MHAWTEKNNERAHPVISDPGYGALKDLLITFTLRRLMDYIPILPTP
jgi:hypothetical protein